MITSYIPSSTHVLEYMFDMCDHDTVEGGYRS